jgi:hypothetical protein
MRESERTNEIGPGCSIEGCSGRHKARGWCDTHLQRFYRYGDPQAVLGVFPPPESLEIRVWRRVVKSDGCWTWLGTHTGPGYAQTTEGGRKIGVHRVVYELLIGPIPPGLELDHLCRNRACINPEHLEPVTHSENMRRAYQWKREAETA